MPSSVTAPAPQMSARVHDTLDRLHDVLRSRIDLLDQTARLIGRIQFHRAATRLHLLDKGRICRRIDEGLSNAARRGAGTSSGAVDSLSSTAALRMRMSIAIVNDLTQYFARAIGQVVRDRQDIDLSLRVRRSPETMALVMDGDVDLGIGYFGTVPRDIIKTTILQSGFSLVCASNHPLANLSKPSLDEISQHRLISFPTGSNMGRRVANAFAAEGIELTGLIEAGSCQSSREFAEVGIGAAIVYTVCLGHERSQKLRTFNLGQTMGLADIAVIRRKTHDFKSAHNDVIAILRTHAGED